MDPIATIDIGSNTIRLLISTVTDHRLQPILEDRALTRLGEGVDATGSIQDQRLREAVAVVGRFVATARALRANPILAVATSAVRDAVNGPELAQDVENATAVHVDVITGRREAELTFLGATAGESVAAPVAVADVGGGSVEIVIADQEGVRWADTLQIGSGRMTERYLIDDPPTGDECSALRAYIDVTLRVVPSTRVSTCKVTGGTASHISRLIARPAGVPTRPNLMRSVDLEHVLAALTAAPSSVVAKLYGVEIERARILPAGLMVIEGIMRHLSVTEAEVAHGGIREGAMIEYLMNRGAWPA